MANPQEQSYTEMVKQTQVALLAMLDTWNRTFQQAFGATPVNSELIDQTFDFADKLVHAQLNAQRQLASRRRRAALRSPKPSGPVPRR